eukprot:NODE_1293_length_1793_cov_176.809581_g1228_i0.p1 GENE.NODE_1293_length_1793_cov_176.809581_g1228_i0~~NODE_1293_length_1793_cov_176.809581_g1228_i0.p1  ORF type:complete len:596 (+),score=166.07 NODE_1293_length_1793_cov_176.809581_g1228_i0:65-1789(+)
MEMQDEAQVREYLSSQRVPQFVDEFVKTLVTTQPDDFKPTLRHLLERATRAQGKGAKALALAEAHASGNVTKALKYSGGDTWSSGGGDWNVPAYCRRDPRLRPSMSQVTRGGVVTHPVTRSEITNPSMRRDYSTTVAAQFNYAVDQCKKVCEEIVAKCESNQQPFFDESFWFGKRDTMYPKGVPSDCTVTEPTEAMRASELYRNAPLFSNSVDSNDIVQGAVGDCFFIGAVSALACCTATDLSPLTRLFVFTNDKWGVYGTLWFKNGGWEWVINDDWVAVSRDRMGNVWPQYACPGAEAELWPLIIEKGYAKVHSCWDMIDGGWGREALEDMTAGLAYTLDLYRTDRREWASDFSRFKGLCEDPLVVLGCAVGYHVADRGGAGRAGEQGAVFGLFKGHAYSVIKAQQTSDGQGFVRVRNPWGNEAEWQGAYGDRSADWARNPLHKRELNPEIKDDGAFWMKWDDFKTIFTDIDVVRFFPYDWVCMSMFGSAPKYDMKPNNVYILHVHKKADIVISLGQDDPKTKSDHHTRKNGRYQKMKLSVRLLSRLPTRFEELKDCINDKIDTKDAATRTLR